MITQKKYLDRPAITQEEHSDRRKELMHQFAGERSIIFLKGNEIQKRNADTDLADFRQESNFRYLTGYNKPNASMLLIPDEGKYVLFVPKQTELERIWQTTKPTHDEMRKLFLADEVLEPSSAADVVRKYQPSSIHTLHESSPFGGLMPSPLAKALVNMRMAKSETEIKVIEHALRITADSYADAIKSTKPGKDELEIRAILEYHYRVNGATYSFPPIVTINGHVLHHEETGGMLQTGRLLLIDSGAEYGGYCADITRTIPVNGKFSREQLKLYNIVLEAKMEATKALKAGVNFKDVHMLAEKIIAKGLLELGILKGNLDKILANGSVRLFFPHGLGHALGGDCHDVGEYPDLVGSDRYEKPTRIRFERILKPGYVVTIEPGIYFNPALLNSPEQRKKHGKFVNFEKALTFVQTVSGIRIENDVLITSSAEGGYRVLGPSIPQEPHELERMMRR